MINTTIIKFKIPQLVIKVIKALEERGFEAYIVGGAVHDLLMNKPTYDWDFTTNAKPEEIQQVFKESFCDNKFGTVGITAEELTKQFKLKDAALKKDGIKPNDIFEITTFRSEESYSDFRRPDKVSWGNSLAEDLKRRDFTINAMALQAISNKLKAISYKVVDLFGGQNDLEKKIIRAVGEAKQRFYEDALRMMRAIRIAAQLGFTIEEKTLTAILKNSSLINKISQERIRDEFLKILKSDYPADGIRLLLTSGLLQFIMPELISTRGVQQAGHHTKDVWNHSLDSLKGCPSPDPIVRLATLLHDIGKPTVAKIIKSKVTFYNHEMASARLVKRISERFKFSKKDKDRLWILIRFHMFAYEPKMTDKAIRRFINRVGKENINDMMILRIGDRKGGGSKATSWRLRELQERIGKLMYTPLQINDLKVDGHDVMKILKIKSGPMVGKVLQSLFEEVMEDDSKNERNYLLERVKSIQSIPGSSSRSRSRSGLAGFGPKNQ